MTTVLVLTLVLKFSGFFLLCLSAWPLSAARFTGVSIGLWMTHSYFAINPSV